ncbi:MAG: TolC family outer membrane protein [Proteobacteria bacterium]|nr:TolC family outer membrane protein [Pseudomonadota bacterium]
MPPYALRHLRPLLCALLACSALPSAAHTDLLGALDAAEQSDPQYRQAQEQALSVAEGIPQARAQLWLPNINFSAGISHIEQSLSGGFSIPGSDNSPTYASKEYRINLSQPVYHHDRYVQLRQANKRLQQAQFEVLAARQDLMLRVAERYFNQLAAHDSLAFAKAETQSLKSQLEQAQQRFQVGLIAITDVQEAQAGHDRAQAAEISAENEVENANEALREVTANYDLDLAPLGEHLPLVVPEPLDIDRWTTTALERNLDLSAANIAADIAHEEIRRQYAGHYPSLDIVGGHSFNKQGGRFGNSSVEQNDIGVQVTVPLYEGGQVVSRTRAAEHDSNASLERLEQTRRAVHRETRQAYLGVVTKISSVKALSQAVVSSQTALESTRAGFEVGTRTAVDVVAAERSLYQAKRDFARARYDYIIETLRLKKAAGSLEPDDLVAANGWLVDNGPATPADTGAASP